MTLKDRHTHTTFSDGKNTAEEMIQAAISLGMTTLGISDHAYTSFDDSFCMKKETIDAYKREVRALQEKYAGQIQVQLGIEQDFFSDYLPNDLDYVIGSLHYVEKDGQFFSVDWAVDIQKELIRKHFDNDFYALAENYFETMSHMVEKTNCDIIGHFDLVTVFTESGVSFDPTTPRYRKAWQKAVDELTKKKNLIFEINTGAVARGYRTKPYPSKEMVDYIYEKGGSFEFTSDSHRTSTLLSNFTLLQKSGYAPADSLR